jgi:hypothetical protein
MYKFHKLLSMTFALGLFIQSHAQPRITLNVTPAGLYEEMISNEHVRNDKGEGFCWHAKYSMNQYLEYYQLTKNTQWLDAAVKYYDFLIAKMDTDPEGYKGWIGPYMYDEKYWTDSHVGDAILMNGMLDFSLLVMENKELQDKYSDKAKEFIELAKRDLIEKYDHRGTWKENGQVGAYVAFDKYIEPGNTKVWKQDSEVTRSGLTHPFNKQNDMGLVCIQLYRLTHQKFYRDRAEKIFLRMKRQMQLSGDHYEWNYWEPFGTWDIDFDKNTPKHWVGINPNPGYQSREVEQMVEAYHNGIVFDETDIRRLINTQLEVMWNRDKVNPAFTNSNVAHESGQRQEVKKATGTLWTSLLDFDPTIRMLYEKELKSSPANSLESLFYYNAIANNPVSFERKYVKEAVNVPFVNFIDCKEIRMAAVVPEVFTKGDRVALVNYSWNPGKLEIALYSANGKDKILQIFKGIKPTDNVIEWDGIDPQKKIAIKGDYRIRWTLGKEFREFPVTIK